MHIFRTETVSYLKRAIKARISWEQYVSDILEDDDITPCPATVVVAFEAAAGCNDTYRSPDRDGDILIARGAMEHMCGDHARVMIAADANPLDVVRLLRKIIEWIQDDPELPVQLAAGKGEAKSSAPRDATKSQPMPRAGVGDPEDECPF